MNQTKNQLEEVIKQSIEEDFNEVQEPTQSKEQTWNEISKYLPRKRKDRFLTKSIKIVAAVFVLLLVGATAFTPSSSTAFGWIKEFFIFQDGSTVYTTSGSRPADESDMQPPSPEAFTVIEGVSETHSVTISEAKELVSFNLYTPTYIPDGYSENEANVHCYNDQCHDITLMYKGAYERSLMIKQQYFEGPYGTGGAISNVVETKELNINGAAATLIITSHENLKFLTWSKHNTEFTVEGYLSEEEILKVAESLNAGSE